MLFLVVPLLHLQSSKKISAADSFKWRRWVDMVLMLLATIVVIVVVLADWLVLQTLKRTSGLQYVSPQLTFYLYVIHLAEARKMTPRSLPAVCLGLVWAGLMITTWRRGFKGELLFEKQRKEEKSRAQRSQHTRAYGFFPSSLKWNRR